MLYYLIRIILWAVVSGGSIIIIKASRIQQKKKAYVRAILLGFLIILLTDAFPFENLLITFRTPEEAFHYGEFRGDIDGILWGENSCAVVYSYGKNPVNIEKFILKQSAGGYKLAGAFSAYSISIRRGGGTHFGINHVRGTQDYYVSCPLWGPEGQPSEPEIFNRDGNQIEVDKLKVGNIGYWYMYFPEDPTGYTLLCDGQKYVIP